MNDVERDWRERVTAAATDAAGEELARLYSEGREIFGDSLGEEWARTLSALDGTAVTG